MDVLAFQFGISYADPLGHRGFTHSISFALLAAAITTWFVCLKSNTFTPKRFVFFVLFLATISHGVLDAFTDAGLGVGFFIPFENSRYFFPWRPIATSPLSISAFFNGPALRILANEFVYIGIPALLVFAAGLLLRMKWKRLPKD